MSAMLPSTDRRIPARRVAVAFAVAVTLLASPHASEPDDQASFRADPEQYAAAIAQAEKMMSDVKGRRLETHHFVIATDVLADGILEQLEGSLEGTYYSVNGVLRLPLAEVDDKVQVYYFESSREYSRTLGLGRGGYLPPGLLAFFQGESDRQELLDVLVHETTHAFLDRFIVTDKNLPTWMHEGFATYMGRSLIHAGQIQPGVFYRVQPQEFLNRSITGRPPAFDAAKRVARRIKRGPLVTLDELVAADRPTFYGTNTFDHYDLAWAFVHFLRHGAPEGEKRFPRLIAAYTGGADTDTAFAASYSRSPAAMQDDFERYVTEVLANPPSAPREVLGR